MGFAPLSKADEDAIAAWIDGGASMAGASGKHWAYVKPFRIVLSKIRDRSGTNQIDSFIQSRLNQEGLRYSPEASRPTLIRRLSLDLIGLPPTLEEVDAFVNDKSPNAYEKVVDRLLASPHYGERQARPWLDLARYADTNGYEADRNRSMWPYRDWVIRALNDNMPFDQFTIEQIAGDMLPQATIEQRVATGFNRNTMLNEEGGIDQGEQRWMRLIDQVATTSQTWLGTTMACAQCHDHKYDPFSQKDFYKMLAFFERSDEPSFELPSPELDPKREELKKKIAESEGKVKPEELQKLKNELNALRGPRTLVMSENQMKAATTHLRIKGGYLSKGGLVGADVPAIMPRLPKGERPNRLGFARWLVSQDNPLTARVTVNRIWEQYFGRGLVETSEDFGTQGARPSHPDLLDWLACEFMDSGWDQKHIHKLIVMSATYRQSSVLRDDLRERDPQNVLLARGPRFRLEAEMIRDNALAISGLLSLKMGGPSVYPDQPEGTWDSPYSGERWNTSQGENKYRRGIYTFWKRTAPYPSFVLLDATSREACTVRRIRTNTPLQALALMNDPVYMEAAKALASRMRGESLDERLKLGFKLCTARLPSASEVRRLRDLYGGLQIKYRNDPEAAKKLGDDAAMTVVANVLLNLDETITRE